MTEFFELPFKLSFAVDEILLVISALVMVITCIRLMLSKSLIEKISTETENSKEHKNAIVSLKKVFLIECRINLKLLAIAKNNKIQKPEIYKLLCKFKIQDI